MITKYNSGDLVMIPAEIEEARDTNGTITYNLKANLYDLPEESIRPNTEAIGVGLESLLRQIDSQRDSMRF